jgi:hypothetical protein
MLREVLYPDGASLNVWGLVSYEERVLELEELIAASEGALRIDLHDTLEELKRRWAVRQRAAARERVTV